MSASAIGHTVWAIADGYIPREGSAGEASHETACILNASDQDAHLTFTLYFTDKAPAGPFAWVVPARRTTHIGLQELAIPGTLPPDTEYACVIESDVPIVVQHTRLDARQAANALLSTMAFPVG